MFKECFLILLLGHILGDYYCQTAKISRYKNERLSYLFTHSIIYMGAMALTAFIMPQRIYAVTAILVGLSHFAVDLIKFLAVKYFNIYTRISEKIIYTADQLFHIAFICIGAYNVMGKAYMADCILNIFYKIGFQPIFVLKIFVLALILYKPANITIKKLIMYYKPDEESENIKNAGGFIGLLERYIILFLLYCNQYSAVGFVLTAKSVARYDKISKDREFAEYYLMGTLLSTFIVFAAYWIIG